MALSKIQSESVNLADDFAFTGTVTGAAPENSVAVICDAKSSSTTGGTFTSGAWRVRDLNTELFDPDGIVSIASNRFTLGAGKYQITFGAPAFKVATHQTALYNYTDSSFVAYGMVQVTAASNDVCNFSTGSAFLNLTGSKTFEIQHRCSATKATNGFGVAATWNGDFETYCLVTIIKV
jgi:hypothetical protein